MSEALVWKNTSSGVRKPRRFRGAVMEALGGVIPFLAVDRAEIPTLGEVRADQPVGVFSFMPRSQEWSGWAKQTVAPRD